MLCALLAPYKALERLDVSDNPILNEGAKALAGLISRSTSIKEITFSGCKVRQTQTNRLTDRQTDGQTS